MQHFLSDRSEKHTLKRTHSPCPHGNQVNLAILRHADDLKGNGAIAANRFANCEAQSGGKAAGVIKYRCLLPFLFSIELLYGDHGVVIGK